MGKASATTRRRRKLEGKTSGDSSTKNVSNDKDDKPSPQSTWAIVKNHPVLWVLVSILIPYGLNLGFRKMVLQTDLLRPLVGRTDKRQLLILGSIMSFGGLSKNGRNQYDNNMASNLRREFGLEIGFQDADASWNFVRDGTASWIHGVRYLERGEQGSFDQRIRHLCRLRWALTYNSRDRYGFERTVFGGDADFNNCSAFNPDSRRCELPVCEESLKKEYGCALGATGSGSDSCDPMPFQTTLVQTRQPWHLVRSLVESYCWKKDSVQEDMPSLLEDLLSTLGWIPRNDNGNENDNKNDNENDSKNDNKNDAGQQDDAGRGHCVNQFIDYVAGYYNTVLDRGSDVRSYRIEDTSPCEVAELAGFLRPETTVHAPNHERIFRKCASAGDADVGHAASSQGGVEVDDDDDLEVLSVTRDLLPHVTAEHLERVKQLFARLGYDYSED